MQIDMTQRILTLWSNNFSIEQISERLGITREYVSRALARSRE
jgi:transposase-like protein